MAKLKSTLNLSDLYGYSVICEYLKKHFVFVSFCLNSIPKAGSRTYQTKGMIITTDEVNVIRTISHKNGNVTIQTDKGYLQFFN